VQDSRISKFPGINRFRQTEAFVEIVRKQMEPGVVVLELVGPLQMGMECTRLGLAIDQLIKEKQRRLVLDFSRVSKMDSGGVGRLVTCFSQFKIAGGMMHLAGIQGMVNGVLKLTKVDRLIKIYPTVKEAAAGFAEAQPPSAV
jgi:anti-sigma B factor antagonist